MPVRNVADHMVNPVRDNSYLALKPSLTLSKRSTSVPVSVVIHLCWRASVAVNLFSGCARSKHLIKSRAITHDDSNVIRSCCQKKKKRTESSLVTFYRDIAPIALMEDNVASSNLCYKLLVVFGLKRGISAEPKQKKSNVKVSACAQPLPLQVYIVL